MGVPLSLACLLMHQNLKGYSGKLLQLGRQSVLFSWNDLNREAKRLGFKLRTPEKIQGSNIPRFADKGYISDKTLFFALGFDEVDSVDFSAFEGSSWTHDFNQPLPKDFGKSYDYVLDSGTLEHIFNFPVAISNIHQLLKVGGYVTHVSPVSNWVDHGFYSFSPTLFYEYYKVNRYAVETAFIFDQKFARDGDRWDVYRYGTGVLGKWFGQFKGYKNRLGLFLTAKKLESSTFGLVPQQAKYAADWQKGDVTVGAKSTESQGPTQLVGGGPKSLRLILIGLIPRPVKQFRKDMMRRIPGFGQTHREMFFVGRF